MGTNPDLSQLLMVNWSAILITIAVLYAYFSLMVMIIAGKTGTAGAWLAWVPIANLVLMCRIAKVSSLWVLVVFIPIINLIAMAVIWMGIAKRCGKSSLVGLLMLVPGLGLIVLAYLALGTVHAGEPVESATSGLGIGTTAPRAMPKVCPACGRPECVGETFCGYTGQRIVPDPRTTVAAPPTAVAARPAAAPAAGGRLGKVVIVGALTVAVLFLAVGALQMAGGALYKPPQQQPPQLPQRLAGTLTEFPVDTAPVPARPTGVVSQSFSGNETEAQVKVAKAALPPGIAPAVLPKLATSVTSAVYKTPSQQAPVNVHVLDARGITQDQLGQLAGQVQTAAGADAVITGVRAQNPNGAEYGGYRVRTPNSDTYLLAKTVGDIVVLIFSPEPAGRETAARLAGNLGNGAGLLEDAAVRGMIYSLPAAPPPGFELGEVTVTDLDRMPEQLGASLQELFGQEGQRWAEQVSRLAPERLTTSIYRGPGAERVEVYVGDYGGGVAAWSAWTMLRWVLRASSSTKLDVHGTTGLRIAEDNDRMLLFQRGPFVVIVHGDGESSDAGLVALANSLQM